MTTHIFVALNIRVFTVFELTDLLVDKFMAKSINLFFFKILSAAIRFHFKHLKDLFTFQVLFA